jgi:hypothetical protein
MSPGLQPLNKTGIMKKKVQIQKTDKLPGQAASAMPGNDPTAWIGSMKGTFEILGDILSPASDEQDWEALRD